MPSDTGVKNIDNVIGCLRKLREATTLRDNEKSRTAREAIDWLLEKPEQRLPSMMSMIAFLVSKYPGLAATFAAALEFNHAMLAIINLSLEDDK